MNLADFLICVARTDNTNDENNSLSYFSEPGIDSLSVELAINTLVLSILDLLHGWCWKSELILFSSERCSGILLVLWEAFDLKKNIPNFSFLSHSCFLTISYCAN